MNWFWWIITVWRSISFGFILGAVWCGLFKRIERMEGAE